MQNYVFLVVATSQPQEQRQRRFLASAKIFLHFSLAKPF
jgi:hypothetical protein